MLEVLEKKDTSVISDDIEKVKESDNLDVVDNIKNGTESECDVIKEGDPMILQKFNYMRSHVLNSKRNVQLGRDVVSMAGLVGEKYGTTFEMKANPANKKQFLLVKADQVIDFEELFLTGEGGQDNRDLEDTENSQKLSRQEVESMRDAGVSGKEIMEKLIENSETYQSKTKFSQAKFLKKKARKYHHYIMIRKPSLRLLIDILYKMDPLKIMNLRIDSLSQILNLINVHSGGRYMVYETGAQGIVVSGLLERLGDEGELVHVYQNQPQSHCLHSMGLNKSPLLKYLSIEYMKSQERENSINPEVKEGSVERSCAGKLNGNTNEANTDTSKKPKIETSGGVSETNITDEPAAKKPKLETSGGVSETNNESVDKQSSAAQQPEAEAKPVKYGLKEKSIEAFESVKAESLDGLVIVCKHHPGNLIRYLAKYIKPSRPFVVYSQYKEPLMETFMELKEKELAVMCHLSETWLRSHQVLPQRTHPTVLMSGGGGYILSGIFVQN